MSWHFYKTCSRCVLIFLWQLYCLYKCRTDVFDLFFRDLRDCNKRIRAFWRVGVLKCVHRALLYTTQCMHIYFLSCSCLTIVNVICNRTHNVMPTIKPYKKIGKKMKLHLTTPNTYKTGEIKIKCEVKSWSVSRIWFLQAIKNVPKSWL